MSGAGAVFYFVFITGWGAIITNAIQDYRERD